MKKIKFEYGKEFATPTGGTITMKSLLTIRGEQYVQCNENDKTYRISELTQVVSNV